MPGVRHLCGSRLMGPRPGAPAWLPPIDVRTPRPSSRSHRFADAWSQCPPCGSKLPRSVVDIDCLQHDADCAYDSSWASTRSRKPCSSLTSLVPILRLDFDVLPDPDFDRDPAFHTPATVEPSWLGTLRAGAFRLVDRANDPPFTIGTESEIACSAWWSSFRAPFDVSRSVTTSSVQIPCGLSPANVAPAVRRNG